MPCCATPMDRAGTRRRKVTDAARKLFAAKGFHNTGMAELAAESDVRVGQIYRDFPCKEAIVAAIVEADFASFIDADSLACAVARGDRGAVLDAIKRLFDPAPCDALMAEITAEAARNPRIAEIVATVDSQARARLAEALAVFAPGTAMAARRLEVAEVILVLAVGACHRALLGVTMTPPVCAIITREIDALTAESLATTAAAA